MDSNGTIAGQLTISFTFFRSMEGGELFQRIQERRESPFTERGEYLAA